MTSYSNVQLFLPRVDASTANVAEGMAPALHSCFGEICSCTELQARLCSIEFHSVCVCVCFFVIYIYILIYI